MLEAIALMDRQKQKEMFALFFELEQFFVARETRGKLNSMFDSMIFFL